MDKDMIEKLEADMQELKEGDAAHDSQISREQIRDAKFRTYLE